MKGIPLSFRCSKVNRAWQSYAEQASHRVVRTGRTRTTPRASYRGGFGGSLAQRHEYECSCGHVGWSAHRGILRVPVREANGL